MHGPDPANDIPYLQKPVSTHGSYWDQTRYLQGTPCQKLTRDSGGENCDQVAADLW